MLKWYKHPASFLLILLVSTSLVVSAAGVTLKYTVAKSSVQMQGTMAIAIPFLMLRGDMILNAAAPIQLAVQPDAVPPALQGKEERFIGPVKPVEAEIPAVEQSADVPRAFVPVEEDYFDSALFIGDSRTVGLANYGRLGQADYFADVGMSTFNLFDKSISDQNFAAQGLGSLLQAKEYRTIYIMLGINELGYPLESIEKQFGAVLSEIQEAQPEAVIIMAANLGITRGKEQNSSVLSMERIRLVNGIIASYADDQRIFYLDVNPYFSDESGYLRSEVTSDGAHPYASEYRNWAIWLKGYGLEEVVK